MIRSMTGYGSARRGVGRRCGPRSPSRSLNHRFLDLSVHLPRRLQPLEREIKDLVQARVSRGRVEVAVQAAFPRRRRRGGGGVRGRWSASLVRDAARHAERVRPGRRACACPTSRASRARSSASERRPRAGRRAAATRILAAGGAGPGRAGGDARGGGRRACAATCGGGWRAVEAGAGRIEALSASAREAQRDALLARVRELVARAGPGRAAALPGGRAAGGAARRDRGAAAPAQPRGPGPRALLGRRARGQAAGLPGPGAGARGEHHRQQGRRPRPSCRRW